MAERKKIKKGLDIPLKGKPSDRITEARMPALVAIYPDDFPGCIWKAIVKAGDEIEKGSPLMCDKNNPDICLVSPAKGTVKEINRGERRHINFISVETKNDDGSMHDAVVAGDYENDETKLMKNGLWAMMRQRPYDIVPDAAKKPRDIFITAFDSSPLAGEILDDELSKWLEKGIEHLSKMTEGKVYLSVKPGQEITSSVAEVYVMEGPHPAGNTGTQIAAIKPVNKGETVWTLDAATAARIGKLMAADKLDTHTTVAITGPLMKTPRMVRTVIGASIESIIKGEYEPEKGVRIISGNVLTGIKTPIDGFLHYPYRQITVIEEGDDADEFMGWASVNPKKYSVKHSFPAFLRGLSKPFDFDARIKGGKRAMIMSGEYDKVFPFDIYPEYLIKAIMAGDIDRMEKLGIYEVAPEDFALPEFVDTSKIELQKIVREGLDNLRKELE